MLNFPKKINLSVLFFFGFFASLLTLPLVHAQENTPVKIVIAESILPSDEDTGVGAQAARAVLRAFKEKYPWIEISRFSGLDVKSLGSIQDVAPLMAIAGDISPQ